MAEREGKEEGERHRAAYEVECEVVWVKARHRCR